MASTTRAHLANTASPPTRASLANTTAPARPSRRLRHAPQSGKHAAGHVHQSLHVPWLSDRFQEPQVLAVTRVSEARAGSRGGRRIASSSSTSTSCRHFEHRGASAPPLSLAHSSTAARFWASAHAPMH